MSGRIERVGVSTVGSWGPGLPRSAQACRGQAWLTQKANDSEDIDFAREPRTPSPESCQPRTRQDAPPVATWRARLVTRWIEARGEQDLSLTCGFAWSG